MGKAHFVGIEEYNALRLVLDFLALEQGELPVWITLARSVGRRRQSLGRMVSTRSLSE